MALIALAATGLGLVLHGKLNADEGFYLVASRFVADGLRPFRDFGFTQTPLGLYANVPWLTVFGYDLTGIRLTGLAWTLITVMTAVIVLRRWHGWTASTLFAVLLLGAPGWLSLCTKGKAYAFSSLTVVLGTIALTMSGSSNRRWSLFLIAAALGVGSRLPTAAFFLPAGIGLLWQTPGWRPRALVIGITVVVAGLTLAFVTGGSWDAFWFWTAQFHTASNVHPPYGPRALEFLALGPALWVALAFATVAVVRGRDRTTSLALAALAAGILVNVLPRSAYAEYASTFLPALAFVIALELTPSIAPWRAVWVVPAAVAVVATGWIWPPEFRPNILVHAGEAATFLQRHTPPGSTIIASMPELAVAARRRIPTTLTMGKFAVTEDLSPTDAARWSLVTPTTLTALISDPATSALALSVAEKWNFAWSVPNYHYLSDESRTMILAAIERDYEPAFGNSTYVIFLRRSTPR